MNEKFNDKHSVHGVDCSARNYLANCDCGLEQKIAALLTSQSSWAEEKAELLAARETAFAQWHERFLKPHEAAWANEKVELGRQLAEADALIAGEMRPADIGCYEPTRKITNHIVYRAACERHVSRPVTEKETLLEKMEKAAAKPVPYEGLKP